MKKVFYLLLIGLLLSCSKTEQKQKQKQNIIKQEEKTENEIITYTPKIKIEKIKKLNVENFVKIYISKMEQDIMWIIKMRKIAKGKNIIEADINTQDVNSFIKQKKEFERKFFQSWGISQKEFENFANKNAEKIEEYLNKNKKMQKLLDQIYKINEKLYESKEEDDIDDEYYPND